MDLTSSWVFLVVILMGGFIALYADRLGRNLGKKRLKLGSLRPRRTAEIIVFSAGMLTPLIAIAAIMAVSAEARIWILRGYAAAREARQAVQDRERALEQYKDVVDQVRSMDIQLSDLENRLENARKDSAQAEENARKSEGRAKTANARVGALSQQVAQRQKALGSVQNNLSEARTTLNRTLMNFNTARKQRDEANEQVEQLYAQIEGLNSQIRTGEGDLGKLRNELATKQSELRQAEEARQRAVEELNDAVEAMQLRLDQARQTLTQLETEMREAAARWLTEPLIFRKDEELTRLAVSAQLSQSEANRALETVLSNSRKLAADRGAGLNDSGQEAGLMPLPLEDGTRISPDEQRERLTRVLTGAPEPRLIVVRATFNRFAGQFVPVQITVHSNPIVFRENELLGEGRIDHTMPVGRMFESIGAILQNQVKVKAQERGMVPVIGREDAYGSVTPEDIFGLISAIQGFGRPARLQILAKNDTRAGGPLALDFRLR